jgi:C4-dicarboxylate-specific signal transduction histidine kinase
MKRIELGNVVKSVRGMFSHDAMLKELSMSMAWFVRFSNWSRLRSEKSIRLVLEITAKQDVMVRGSEVQLQQVLLNVITNAIEAMDSTMGRERLLRVTLRAKRWRRVHWGGGFGPGIDQNNVDKIFDPFFTTKHQGMGLGLSICRSIASGSHGGN